MVFGFEVSSESGANVSNDADASIAHVVLSCVAGQGVTHWKGFNFSMIGMHANLCLFGLLGYLRNQSARFKGLDVGAIYGISTNATRYLAIPCMMADLYQGNPFVGGLHLLSGLLPFCLSMIGVTPSMDTTRAAQVGNLAVAGNIISLGHFSLEKQNEWGCYTAAAAIFSYYSCPSTGPKIMYPIGLALMEYCAYRTFKVRLERKKIILNFITAVLLAVDSPMC